MFKPLSAVILAAIVFVVLFVILGVTLWVSILAGVGGFILGWMTPLIGRHQTAH